jgi:hypothetical protein
LPGFEKGVPFVGGGGRGIFCVFGVGVITSVNPVTSDVRYRLMCHT